MVQATHTGRAQKRIPGTTIHHFTNIGIGLLLAVAPFAFWYAMFLWNSR